MLYFIYFIIVYETWIHHYKKQKWFRLQAPVFSDSHFLVFVDFLKQDKKITGEYYASLLDRL